VTGSVLNRFRDVVIELAWPLAIQVFQTIGTSSTSLCVVWKFQGPSPG